MQKERLQLSLHFQATGLVVPFLQVSFCLRILKANSADLTMNAQPAAQPGTGPCGPPAGGEATGLCRGPFFPSHSLCNGLQTTEFSFRPWDISH